MSRSNKSKPHTFSRFEWGVFGWLFISSLIIGFGLLWVGYRRWNTYQYFEKHGQATVATTIACHQGRPPGLVSYRYTVRSNDGSLQNYEAQDWATADCALDAFIPIWYDPAQPSSTHRRDVLIIGDVVFISPLALLFALVLYNRGKKKYQAGGSPLSVLG